MGLGAGGIKHLWKAAGRYQVIGVFDMPDGNTMDAALHALPIWKLGHHEMVQNIQWIPLRDYRDWANDLKTLGVGYPPASTSPVATFRRGPSSQPHQGVAADVGSSQF